MQKNLRAVRLRTFENKLPNFLNFWCKYVWNMFQPKPVFLPLEPKSPTSKETDKENGENSVPKIRFHFYFQRSINAGTFSMKGLKARLKIWSEIYKQWAPLNWILDNVINRVMGSNLSRTTKSQITLEYILYISMYIIYFLLSRSKVITLNGFHFNLRSSWDIYLDFLKYDTLCCWSEKLKIIMEQLIPS